MEVNRQQERSVHIGDAGPETNFELSSWRCVGDEW